MRSKNHPPTAAQKVYWNELVGMGCINHPAKHAEIDHIYGASAKHNKLKIGGWAVVPLCPECHRLGKNNRTSNEGGFNKQYVKCDTLREMRIELLKEAHMSYERYHGRRVPIPRDVLEAMYEYKR